MSDLVERLLKTPHLSSLEEEAAEEIVRLRSQVKQLEGERTHLIACLDIERGLNEQADVETRLVRDFVKYVRDYSNDPQIVERAHALAGTSGDRRGEVG